MDVCYYEKQRIDPNCETTSQMASLPLINPAAEIK
jgi:hypothetical protein